MTKCAPQNNTAGQNVLLRAYFVVSRQQWRFWGVASGTTPSV